MTTTAGAIEEERLAVALRQRQHQQVEQAQPAGHAPEEADDQAVLELAPSVGSRVHDTTILLLIVAVQGTWLLVLGYGMLRLLS